MLSRGHDRDVWRGSWNRGTPSAPTGSSRCSARAGWASSSRRPRGRRPAGRAEAAEARALRRPHLPAAVPAGGARRRRGARTSISSRSSRRRRRTGATTSRSDYVDGGSLDGRLARAGAAAARRTPSGVVDEIGSRARRAARRRASCTATSSPRTSSSTATGPRMLTDFGLAKGRAYTVLTRPGQVMGTLDYLAPELIRGQPASPRRTSTRSAASRSSASPAGRRSRDKTLFQVGLAHLEEQPPDPAPTAGPAAGLLAPRSWPRSRRIPSDAPATAAEYASAAPGRRRGGADRMTPALVFTEGRSSGQRFELEGELVIGREDAGITIDDAEISRRHAVVRPREGGIEIEDLGSLNGTFVNGVRIEAADPARRRRRGQARPDVLEVESSRSARRSPRRPSPRRSRRRAAPAPRRTGRRARADGAVRHLRGPPRPASASRGSRAASWPPQLSHVRASSAPPWRSRSTSRSIDAPRRLPQREAR